MTPTHLHTYQCSFCRSTATTSVKSSGLVKCRLCFRLMAFLFSVPIETDEQREQAAGPIVFRFGGVSLAPPTEPTKRCARRGCYTYKPVSDLLNGRFCSEECGAQDSRDFKAFMDRLEDLYQRKPYLRPVAREKESA